MIGCTFFIACENDPEEVDKLADETIYPDQSLKEVDILYTTKGQLEFRLQAPVLHQYSGEKAYSEMPDGIIIEVYDSAMQVTSRLSSNYAIDLTHAGQMEAREDVVVINSKGEKLNTEELIWDQKTKKITSDKFVKITTEDQVLMGEGLIANEDFTEYRILDPRGTINIDHAEDH